MKAFFLLLLLCGFYYVTAQDVGPASNVGREYGNAKMPLMVSHLAGANKERLKRENKNARHSIFGKILCFRKLCRIQSGHTASLRAISMKKFRKKVKKNSSRGMYQKPQRDSPYTPKPLVLPNVTPRPDDTTSAPIVSKQVVRSDTLIVLGAELLFETNKAVLRREHFAMLSNIVAYLAKHPERSVKISGHTDNTGDEAHNLALSIKRADGVAAYLVEHGVNRNRVTTHGLGSAQPLEPNDSEEARKKNRRVELLIQDSR